jgi:hypothetical protein
MSAPAETQLVITVTGPPLSADELVLYERNVDEAVQQGWVERAETDELGDQLYRVTVARVASFYAELREKGVHVGVGQDPCCVTCDERWPCAASRAPA